MLFDKENDDMKVTFDIMHGRKEAPLVEVWLEDGIGHYPAWQGYRLTATSFYGDCYLHDREFDTIEEVETFLDLVKAAVGNGRELDSEHWSFYRFIYGSKGWFQEVEPELVKADKDSNYMLPAIAKY